MFRQNHHTEKQSCQGITFCIYPVLVSVTDPVKIMIRHIVAWLVIFKTHAQYKLKLKPPYTTELVCALCNNE